MDDLLPVTVPEDVARSWTESSVSARINSHILRNVGNPAPTSNLTRTAELYPYESIALRAKAYLQAGLEHLNLWADFSAPLRFHPDHRTTIDLRPAYTLSRAAMEASAHALWIFGTNDPMECIRRHICLMRWDLDQHAKSKATGSPEKQQVLDRNAELVTRVSGVFSEKEIPSPGSYLTLLRFVCDSAEYNFDIENVEWIWRAASGAAHGKFWVGQELQTEVETTDESGAKRTVFVPDTDGIVRALETASLMCSSGVGKFAMWSGRDPVAMSKDGFTWLAHNMTYRDETDPSVIAAMKAGEAPHFHA